MEKEAALVGGISQLREVSRGEMRTVAQSKRDRLPPLGVKERLSGSLQRVRLQCTRCGHEVAYVNQDEKCGACGWEWLDIVYRGVTRDDIITDDDALGRTSMWRFRNFLPISDDRNIVSMGEGVT